MCGSTPPPPDYAPMQRASDNAARMANEQANAQLDFAKMQYEENKGIGRAAVEQQMAAQDQQMTMAGESRQFWKDNYEGLEKDMAADAANYNTDANREMLAGQAAADAGMAFNQTSDATSRNMRSMGVNPNSGKYKSQQRNNAIGMALGRGGAMNNTRRLAEQEGQRRMAQSVGIGRGMNSTALSAFGGAGQAGSQAVGNMGVAGGSMMAGMQGAGGLMMQGANAQMQGLGQVLSSQSSLYESGMNNQAQMMSAGIGMAGGMMGGSDRRLKSNIEFVGVDEATQLNIYEFNYKGSDTLYQGVMADEVIVDFPEAVEESEHGFKMVNYGKLGIEFKELG